MSIAKPLLIVGVTTSSRLIGRVRLPRNGRGAASLIEHLGTSACTSSLGPCGNPRSSASCLSSRFAAGSWPHNDLVAVLNFGGVLAESDFVGRALMDEAARLARSRGCATSNFAISVDV